MTAMELATVAVITVLVLICVLVGYAMGTGSTNKKEDTK